MPTAASTSHGYYRYSGRFSGAGVASALGLGCVAGIALGAAYAYVDLYNPIAGYITCVVTGGTGWLLGKVLARQVVAGKVRNVGMAMFIAAIAGLVMLVAAWEMWLFALLQRANQPVSLSEVLLNPGAGWAMIQRIDDAGAWSIQGTTPTGPVLALLWLLEAGMLVGIPVVMACKAVLRYPFCEKCGQWCKMQFLGMLNPGEKASIRTRLESRDFAALSALGKAASKARFWNVYFQGCGQCDETQTLCLDEVTISRDKKGKVTTAAKSIVRRLSLAPEETVSVATEIAMLTAVPEPAAPEPATIVEVAPPTIKGETDTVDTTKPEAPV